MCAGMWTKGNRRGNNPSVTAEPMGAPAPRKRKQSATRRRSDIIDGRRDSTRWRELRERWQARLPVPCPRCAEPVQPWEPWDLDHVGDPVAFGGRSGADKLHPAHRSCNRQAGKELGDAIRAVGVATLRGDGARFFGGGAASPGSRPPQLSPDAPADPETPPPDSDVWNACPWLADLRTVPPEATWPRLMSLPHPNAVGTYGIAAEEWITETYGQALRWWQRLALFRLLEYDAHGELVWIDAVVSTARQVGKSVLLAALAAWRMHSAEVFREPQRVMHTGKDLGVCRQVQAPARIWARAHGLRVIETNGKESMTADDGSEWLIRAGASVYGYPATLALADEAWAIRAADIDEGLEPTMAERLSAQILLFSTAHRKATGLVPLRRAGAFATWAEPASTLLLEWSAPRDSAVDDRDAWRLASPHWSRPRERLLEAKYARIVLGQSDDPDENDAAEAFRSQFLNVWPVRALLPRGNAEPLADRATWDHARDDYASATAGEPITVAIEDWYGMGAAAAACASLPDGRLLTWGALFASRADAYAWAAWTMGRRDGSTLLVGATLGEAEAAEHVPEAATVGLCTTTTTRAALPLVRSLLRSGRLAHSGDADMGAQVCTVRLIASPSGGLVFAHGDAVRPDLLKAMSWAVADRAAPLVATPDWFVF